MVFLYLKHLKFMTALYILGMCGISNWVPDMFFPVSVSTPKSSTCSNMPPSINNTGVPTNAPPQIPHRAPPALPPRTQRRRVEVSGRHGVAMVTSWCWNSDVMVLLWRRHDVVIMTTIYDILSYLFLWNEIYNVGDNRNFCYCLLDQVPQWRNSIFKVVFIFSRTLSL